MRVEKCRLLYSIIREVENFTEKKGGVDSDWLLVH